MLAKKLINEILKNSFIFNKILVKRDGPPPKIRKWMEKYKNYRISEIIVCRKPVQGAIKKVLNIVSLGKFDKSLKGLNYEDIFHLYLYLKIGNKSFRIEKNEIVELVEDSQDLDEDCKNIDMKEKTAVSVFRPKQNKVQKKKFQKGLFFSNPNRQIQKEPKYFPKRQIRIKALIKNGENFQKNFWDYNPKGNNCQNFVESILIGNRFIKKGDEIHQFIKQDSEAIFRNNPKYLAKFGKTLTDIAAVFDTLKEGK